MSEESPKILNEEELQKIEIIYGLHIEGGHKNYKSVADLINSHRSQTEYIEALESPQRIL